MNILAIDTTNELLSLALQTGQEQYSLQLRVDNKQSEHILPKILDILSKAQININQINNIAYNMGPGSFTGLRIGLSIAIGLAYSIGCDLYPIPTFLPYAHNIAKQHKNHYTGVVLDAKLEQVYVAIVKSDNLELIKAPELINPEELENYINMTQIQENDLLITGNGWVNYKDKINKNMYNNLVYVESKYPEPLTMLEIIAKDIIKPCSVREADLLYLRNKVALNLAEQQQSKLK